MCIRDSPCIWCGSTRWQLNNLFFMGNARVYPGVSFCFPRRECYFAHGGKVTKTPPGTAPMSAYAQRALIVAFPRTPFTGDALLKDRLLRPAAPKTRPCLLLAPGLRPYVCKIWWTSALKLRRLPWQNRGSWVNYIGPHRPINGMSPSSFVPHSAAPALPRCNAPTVSYTHLTLPTILLV